VIINIVVPKLNKTKYTGGLVCILHYANELHSRGHTVNIIPSLPSEEPLWFKKPFGNFVGLAKTAILLRLFKNIGSIVVSVAKLELFSDPFLFRDKTSILISNLLLLIGSRFTSTNIESSLSRDYLSQIIPKANHTIATTYQTALTVKAIGTGETWYFCQHFEAYFSNESQSPKFAYVDAIASYHVGLNLIANSTWLSKKLSEETNSKVALCPNAIDHEVFNKQKKKKNSNKTVTIISYGGRDAEWKGFHDMANAVKIAREKLPDIQIVWNVYGDALLPEDNPIASYQSLGFLNSMQLTEAYNTSDILLSASWYESFPLFPIEAMACGLAVITTSKGTEDYAINNETALVVEARNCKSIADAIIALVTDKKKRLYLAENGQMMSKKFTWEKSGNKLEEILVEGSLQVLDKNKCPPK